MVPELWEECLASHPDRAYIDYLVRGLREGFQVGFRHGSKTCRSASTNMQSADVRPEVRSSFLESETAAGRVLGPVEPDIAAHVQVNRFGLVPKDTNLDSGAALWTCRSQEAIVSTMVSNQSCERCTILLLTKCAGK